MPENRKCLQVIVEDIDTYDGAPLHEAILRFLHRKGVAGATAWFGIEGYGSSQVIHKQGLFGMSDERPVVIVAIDAEDRLRAVLPDLLAMAQDAMITLSDVEVFQRSGRG